MIALLSLSPVRAAIISGLVAFVCYAGSLNNEWAMDDERIIQKNESVHRVGAALENFFEPYWPEINGTSAGQYRPLAILWYSIDWALSGGHPAWFHFVNVVVHALATALLVLVVSAWLPSLGALVAGLVFAVHPVHVEAVANVVGRAELAASVGLLGGLLCARRYRTAAGPGKSLWLGATLCLVLASLLIKENAIVFLALLALDEMAQPGGSRFAANAPLYYAVIAVSLGWFYLWTDIAGEFVIWTETSALRGASFGERLATMFPAYLDVARLLVWPMDLAPDYNPQMIVRRTNWSLIATVGVCFALAVLLLACLVWNKARAVTVAVFAAVIVYSPTSNFLFATGVLLAERTLYLAVWAPAAVCGWLLCHAPIKYRRMVFVGFGAIVLAFGARTVQRVPEWKDTEQILTAAFAEHSENYRGHMRVGNLRSNLGDPAGSLAHAMVAGTLYPYDPSVTLISARQALDLGYAALAFSEAERGFALKDEHPQLTQLAVRLRIARGSLDSAVAGARMSVDRHPEGPLPAETYIEVLNASGAPAWALSFAHARRHWISAELEHAFGWLSQGVMELRDATPDPSDCWDLERAIPLMEALMPAEADRIRARARLNRTCEQIGAVGAGAQAENHMVR